VRIAGRNEDEMTTIDMADALDSIGITITDIPDYCITDGRIVISVADNEEGEGEETLAELRRNLPDGAKADWTGSSGADGYGDTTSDIEITWETYD